MNILTNPDSGSHRRKDEYYHLTNDEISQYKENGYLILDDVLTEEELQPLDHWFDYFTAGKHEGMGRDLCDMSQPYSTPFEDYKLVNAMLPSLYKPEMADNIFLRVAQTIADQLCDCGIAKMDYEQFLGKKPGAEKAEFALHQDLGYWPKTNNTWTATFSLALSDSNIQNGCLQVVPGTNNEPELRIHLPKAIKPEQEQDMQNRDDIHTLVIEEKNTDELGLLPVKRGSLTVHDERIVHGSAGNNSNEWRKTYVMAFREKSTVEEERAMGFTHSHNDKVNWKTALG